MVLHFMQYPANQNICLIKSNSVLKLFFLVRMEQMSYFCSAITMSFIL